MHKVAQFNVPLFIQNVPVRAIVYTHTPLMSYITRGRIVVPSVVAEMLSKTNGGTGCYAKALPKCNISLNLVSKLPHSLGRA